MSPDFTVAEDELATASACLADEAGNLAGITLDAPDVSMYGKLVGSAAASTEPATTEDVNALLRALSTTVQALSDRAQATCDAYRTVEVDNASLGSTISAGLEGSGGAA